MFIFLLVEKDRWTVRIGNDAPKGDAVCFEFYRLIGRFLTFPGRRVTESPMQNKTIFVYKWNFEMKFNQTEKVLHNWNFFSHSFFRLKTFTRFWFSGWPKRILNIPQGIAFLPGISVSSPKILRFVEEKLKMDFSDAIRNNSG